LHAILKVPFHYRYFTVRRKCIYKNGTLATAHYGCFPIRRHKSTQVNVGQWNMTNIFCAYIVLEFLWILLLLRTKKAQH